MTVSLAIVIGTVLLSVPAGVGIAFLADAYDRPGVVGTAFIGSVLSAGIGLGIILTKVLS